MRLARAYLVAALLAGVAGSLLAQPGYVPLKRMPDGREIVAVYFGGTDCGACHFPEVKSAVRAMKGLVAAQATQRGASFSVIGVANDWTVADGVKFLEDVGPFDQIVVGSNWTNLAIERFVWSDSTTQPALPQIILFERSVKADARVVISEPRILRRVVGGVDIPAWVAAGAPITQLARP